MSTHRDDFGTNIHNSKTSLDKKVMCIDGLGYVGYPILIEFIEHFKVLGFDINKLRFYL